MKDPPGGTTGRVKPYWRLGWMGARAEYGLYGEGLPLPHTLSRGRLAARSNWLRIFYSFGRSFRSGQPPGPLLVDRREQLPQNAHGRRAKPFVAMNDLDTL